MSILFLIIRLIIPFSREYYLEWRALEWKRIRVGFLILIDQISLLFLRTVLIISRGVAFFRIEYMEGDCLSNRFRGLVLMFILAIALLIISPSLARLLMGWDGLGVTSYLLVCYYRRETSYNARILTALVNRVGDVALLLAISINVRNIINYGTSSSRILINVELRVGLVLLARITKRAQVPFSAWLPAAIAAPTPVSALVHSSTLVTAGVYLLIRFNCLLELAGFRWILIMMGRLTMLMAGGSALLEIDMKKIIALSTLRQLGVIFFRLGLGFPIMTFFHLLSHAYFKAILFIAAGALIHRINDYQNIQILCGGASNFPLLGRVILVGRLRLCGIPFLSGFYSKDIILEIYLMGDVRLILLVIVLLATIFTVLYSIRLGISLFLGVNRISAMGGVAWEKEIKLGISLLVIPSIIGGWGLLGLTRSNCFIWVRQIEKILIFSLVILSGMIIYLSKGNLEFYKKMKGPLGQIWFLPIIIRPFLNLSCFKRGKTALLIIDRGWAGHRAGVVSRFSNFSRYSSRNLGVRLLISLFLGLLLVLFI